jgi:23S rRNA (adenine2503-C2)-methyltransferase
LTREELESFIQKLGWGRFRADQIFAWIYRRGVSDPDQMSDLSRAHRRKLAMVADVSSLRLRRQVTSRLDATTKFLFELEDGKLIESVLIPEGRRRTICLSTQVGCALGCAYCATGDLGLERNLLAHEIVGQILSMRQYLQPEEDITNVVLMGMGEPLLNYQQTIRACRLMNDPDGLAIGARKITLSTAGVVPGIQRLAKEGLRLGLAISLNASSDRIRDQLIPLNKKYRIAKVTAAAREYARATGRPVTFEYVLIAGVNASAEDALRLSQLVKGIRCKINVIPYNPVAGKAYRTPGHEEVASFMAQLYPLCPTVTLRESRGSDIQAACGQLRGEQPLEQ